MTHIRWLKMGGLLLFITATAVVTIILIISGTFNPKPVGDLVWQGDPVELSSDMDEIVWLTDLPEGDFSVHTAVAFKSGEPDSAVGIVLNGDCPLQIAISPLGYATVHQLSPNTDRCSPITEFPWQPWPHVKTGQTTNEIWVDMVDDELQVRLNRELFWVGSLEFQPTDLEMTVESFGVTAVFEFPKTGLYR